MRSTSHIVRYNHHNMMELLYVFSNQINHLLIVDVLMVNFTSFINLRSFILKYDTGRQLDSIRPQYFPMLEILYMKKMNSY